MTSEPAFSPDGTKIAFVSSRDGDEEIFVMDADDGGNLDQLTENDDEDVSPDWGVPAPVATRTCDDEAATVPGPRGPRVPT